MSAPIRDLWPADIKAEDVASPKEILSFQARLLQEKTNGSLVGHVVRLVGDDRIVLGFEVEAPRADARVRLFDAQHELERDYPVALKPPDHAMPEFLKKHRYVPSLTEIASVAAGAMLSIQQGHSIENEWIASSPTEFAQKVEEILNRADIKGIIFSLLARARSSQNGNRDRQGQ